MYIDTQTHAYIHTHVLDPPFPSNAYVILEWIFIIQAQLIIMVHILLNVIAVITNQMIKLR